MIWIVMTYMIMILHCKQIKSNKICEWIKIRHKESQLI